MNPKTKIVLDGKAWQNGQLVQSECEFNYDNEPIKGYGYPIDFELANDMVVKHWNTQRDKILEAQAQGDAGEVERIIDENIAITFDRKLLLLILSQSECEGIRFYFCIRPDNNRKSLVAMGIDGHGRELGNHFRTDPSAGEALKDESSFSRNGDTVQRRKKQTIVAEIGGGRKGKGYVEPNTPPINKLSPFHLTLFNQITSQEM